MQYNHLKSIVAARKQEIALATPSESFFLTPDRPCPFIEPTFSKIDFPNENPSIIFIQAIGASGKTTTARALSYDLQVPILDLSQHAAVGDRTLTGVLTDAYSWADISTVLTGFRGGTYGVIDGHFYRLDMDACSKVLGVSWQHLRKGETSPKLRDFLASIA